MYCPSFKIGQKQIVLKISKKFVSEKQNAMDDK
jgi:hypothetical protein